MQKSHPVRKLITIPNTRIESTEPLQFNEISKSTQQTQLQKLMEMIQTEKGFQKLEKFSFKLNSPWKPKLDTIPGISIVIPKTDKLSTAEAHLKWLDSNSENSEKCIYYYPDASKLNDGNTGAGLAKFQGPESTQKSWFLGRYMEVFDAELFSILQAIKDAEDHFKNRPSTETNQITNIYIFADSQAALSRISNLALRPGQAVINQITKISESIIKRHQVKPYGRLQCS